jgi:small subunit ribosomal protein S5
MDTTNDNAKSQTETVNVNGAVLPPAENLTPEISDKGAFGAGDPRRAAPGGPRGPRGAGRGGPRGRGGRDGKPRERVKSEFDQKSINVRRVARVVAGGRRFSFSVAMVIGDKKGRVGVGLGKAGDMSSAMDKAQKNARKHMQTIKRTKTNSIAHEVDAKEASARVKIMPAPGRGLVAGSAVRTVLELAGVTDVTSKVHSGSKNALNMARATAKALGNLTK